MILLSSPAVIAATVRLAWDPSPDPTVVAYRIHYGPQSGLYQQVTSLLPNLTGEVSGLTEGNTYYFVVTALNRVGMESRPSNEVTFQIPLSTPANQEFTAHDDEIPTLEDTPVSFQLSGSNPDLSGGTYEITSFPQFGTLDGDPPDLTYYPNPNYFGEDALTFVVRGPLATSRTARVVIDITSVNDAPKATSRTLSVAQNSSVRVTLQGSDIEQDPLTFKVIESPRHGTLSGKSPSLTYKPNTGFSGTDSFRYTAHDGQLTSSPATVRLTVYGTSLSPESQPDTLLVTEAGSASLLTSGENSVLANDSSPSGGSLQARLLTPPTEGTLIFQPNGQFSYRHFGTTRSKDQFTYVATDGQKDSPPTPVHIHVFRIANLREADDAIHLDFTATPMVSYQIESRELTASPTAEWTPVDTLSVASESLISVTDPSPLPTTSRFYRVLALLPDATHVSETWGVTRHHLVRGKTYFSIPLQGPRIRESRVLHIDPLSSSIILEGSPWQPNELAASDGSPSHVAVVTASASPAHVGHWWPISHHSSQTLFLSSSTGPTPHAILRSGDLVEIRQLPNLYSWFGQGADPSRQFLPGQSITAFGDARQPTWSVSTVEDPSRGLGFLLTQDPASRWADPFRDGTSLTLFPGQALLVNRPGVNATRIYPAGRIPPLPLAHYLPSGPSWAASIFPLSVRLNRAGLFESDWRIDQDGYASPAQVDFIGRYGSTESFTPLHYHDGTVKSSGWYSKSYRLPSTPAYALGAALQFSLAPRTHPWVWMEPAPW